MKKSSSCAGAVRGESQTREAATMDGVQRQPLRDGKLLLHKIVRARSH